MQRNYAAAQALPGSSLGWWCLHSAEEGATGLGRSCARHWEDGDVGTRCHPQGLAREKSESTEHPVRRGKSTDEVLQELLRLGGSWGPRV